MKWCAMQSPAPDCDAPATSATEVEVTKVLAPATSVAASAENVNRPDRLMPALQLFRGPRLRGRLERLSSRRCNRCRRRSTAAGSQVADLTPASVEALRRQLASCESSSSLDACRRHGHDNRHR